MMMMMTRMILSYFEIVTFTKFMAANLIHMVMIIMIMQVMMMIMMMMMMMMARCHKLWEHRPVGAMPMYGDHTDAFRGDNLT